MISEILAGYYGFPESGKNGILLYGPNGTGKSTVASLLPDALEAVFTGKPALPLIRSCKSPNNGVRALDAIADRSITLTIYGQKYHYFVLDEVDRLTNEARDELKIIMDSIEYKGLVPSIFIMTTNKPDLVDIGVLDRCIEIPFEEEDGRDRLPLVREVLTHEGIADAASLPDDLLYKAAIQGQRGSVRNILTQSTLLASRIKAQNSMP